VHISALNYEIAHQGAGDLAALQKNGWDKDFIAGVIDVKSVEIEAAEAVADRIRACLNVVKPERLGLSTNCGLINLPRRVAQGKLRSLVEAANIVRAELHSGGEAPLASDGDNVSNIRPATATTRHPQRIDPEGRAPWPSPRPPRPRSPG
jgi:hypothetical protein